MRLRKLLLGSAAAVMVAGAASVPAKAADVNGLVVTMANYLESCSNGNGIQFTDWCFHFSGQSKFTTTFGSRLIYGAAPGSAVETPEGTPAPWSQFNLSNTLGLTATRETPNGKTITFKVPIVGGGATSLAISRAGAYTLTFTGSSVTLALPTDVATFTMKLSESGYAGWWPDFDLTAAATFGNFKVTATGNIGQDDADVNGNAVAPYWNPSAGLDLAYSDGFDFGVGFDWARVDNGGTGNAFGVHATAGATFGMFSISAGVAHSVNADFNRSNNTGASPGDNGYQYDLTPGERIWEVWGKVTVDENSQNQTTLAAYYATSRTTADSETLKIDLQHRFRPYGNSILSLTGELWYQHAWAAAGDQNAIGGGLTITVPVN